MIGGLLLSVLLAAQPPETWTVKAGDSCDSIARATWGDPKKVVELHQWNELGPPPHTLRPGMVLRLRAPSGSKEEGPDATLTFLKPSVRTRHLIEWEPALLGMGLFRLDEVNTLKGAGAALRFRDSSSLLLDESALIVIYGDGKPKKPNEPTGITLVDGELRLAMAQMRARPLAINMPATSIAAAGMKGVVAVDGAQTSRVSVFEGSSQVSARGVTVVVPQNYGTRVRQGQPPEPPRLLPDAPVLAAPMALVVVGADGQGSLRLQWAAAARAEQYRVQIARDEEFVDRERDAWTGANEVTVDRIPPGSFVVRVISFDEVGLQSLPSAATRVEVVVLGGGLDGQGELHLGAGQPLPFTLPSSFKLRVAGQDRSPEATFPVGAHPFSVLDSAGAVKLEGLLVVPPQPPTVLTVGAVVKATFQDDIPEATPPELRSGGATTPFVPVSPRVWEARLPAQGAATVWWHGRPLSRFEVGAEKK